MRKLAAIMFTDIVGYTALMSRDEDRALQLLQHCRELLKPLIQQFHGEWLKEIGDGSLSSFASTIDAVGCAVAIQHVLRRNPDLSLRIGIHLGDVVFENDDVFGDGVNIASRIEPLAEPGGVCITDQVYETIKNKPGIQAKPIGEKALKGIDHPVSLYHVSIAKVQQAEEAPKKFALLHRNRRVWLAAALIAVMIPLILWMLIDGGGHAPGGAKLGNRSIAVIPFSNFSDNPDDEFYSDGITEDILAHLAKINDLTVIARTSVMQYKNTKMRIRDIGQELGVANILEGSVRRAGNRIRIVGQLIKVDTEEHLWAETYDRELADVFAIQTDVAKKIAQALKANLLPAEEQLIAFQPTDNPEAYEWFLRGNNYLQQASFELAGSKLEFEQAIRAYRQAIALDPQFATAWARMSYALTALYFFHESFLASTADQAKDAFEMALQLEPGLPLALLAEGYYQNLVHRNYDESLRLYSLAKNGLQSNSELISEIGFVQMRQGKWDQALSNYKRAAAIDPRSPAIHERLAQSHLYLRNYSEAEQVLDHISTLTADVAGVYADKIELALLWHGDVEEARAVVLEAANYVNPISFLGEGSQIINRLGYWRFGLLQEDLNDIIVAYNASRSKIAKQKYYFSMAQLYNLANRPGLSSTYYDSVRFWVETQLSSGANNFLLQAELGLAAAFLGSKDQAIEAGLRSEALMPISACHW